MEGMRLALADGGTLTEPMSSSGKKARKSGGRDRLQSLATTSVKSSDTKDHDKFAFQTAGPAVKDAGAKLTGKFLNSAPASASLARTVGRRSVIATNVHPDQPTSNETCVSDITSIAEQFNSYRFDETSVLRSYKKMMTLHLKDDMFRKLKFITDDAMLEFSTEEKSVCGYVCTHMRVYPNQWGEYWELVKKSTKKMIESQRTNATTAVKKGFMRTYTTTLVVLVLNAY
jgi:hypothetical protein